MGSVGLEAVVVAGVRWLSLAQSHDITICVSPSAGRMQTVCHNLHNIQTEL